MNYTKFVAIAIDNTAATGGSKFSSWGGSLTSVLTQNTCLLYSKSQFARIQLSNSPRELLELPKLLGC